MKPGEQFGPYRIVRMLGRGAMGEVYLAERDGAQVAIKVVYHGPEPEDAEVLQAERVGAELQQRLAGVDQRVVRVRWFGLIKEDLVIEMEYIEGEDLSLMLARGPLGPGRAAVIGIELCEMLENLSAAGVVHGDLKPRNLRIDTAGRVKVLDFGIAKALSHTRKYTQNVFASTAYCSPERLDTQSMDAQSDLWSVGVLLYQTVSGRLPFEAPTKERLERRIRSGQPPDPLPPECPQPLRDIIFTMLGRDTAVRFQTAREARQELEHFIKGEPVKARPPADAPAQEETVRTAEPAPDATVRTTKPPPVNWPPADKSKSAVVRVRGNRFMVLRGCLIISGLLVAAAAALTAHQVWVWNDAKKLKADLETGRTADLEEAWKRYQDLEHRSHLPLLLWNVERPLKAKLLAAGNEPILEYRNSENPTVRENNWKQALAWFSHALEIDPSDKTVRGCVQLCEGHIERINARGALRLKKLNMAVVHFTESAELLKKWPDPYLGLARIYVYDLNDMDKAEDALEKAANYGHPAGNREKAQLADGYRRRGDRTWKDSRQFTAVPDQEKEYLERAKKDYQRALDLYQEIGLWGDAGTRRVQTMQSLEAVEDRLHELRKGWWPFR